MNNKSIYSDIASELRRGLDHQRILEEVINRDDGCPRAVRVALKAEAMFRRCLTLDGDGDEHKQKMREQLFAWIEKPEGRPPSIHEEDCVLVDCAPPTHGSCDPDASCVFCGTELYALGGLTLFLRHDGTWRSLCHACAEVAAPDLARAVQLYYKEQGQRPPKAAKERPSEPEESDLLGFLE
jgi:hypothetical protein